ncbi:phosphotransferase [Shimia sp. SDUM112013]|uniref:phosphotransferase enzyme family protein n=1 Tax=Shimia sp. SDUM112013 TaxID=3136160 RepID=UPI0032EF3463
MNDAQALEFARQAMRHWGVACEPRLIKNRENAVFEVRAPDDARAALRLHRPGYQTEDAIRSELWWTEALVEGGMVVPLPYRTTVGDVLAYIEEAGRVASLVSWIEGEPMGEGDVPLSGTPEQQVTWHHALGRELARLHILSDNATLPVNFVRPELSMEALLGDAPAWGRFWENPSLSPTEADVLQNARDDLQVVLSDHITAGADFGLIHADALRENVMLCGDRVRLIDFDDGVFGFRMYELGVAMSQNWDQSNKHALGQALLEGYSSLRPLSENAPELLEAFTLLRGLASCGWVIGRYDPHHPATRSYAERALVMCRHWRDGR